MLTLRPLAAQLASIMGRGGDWKRFGIINVLQEIFAKEFPGFRCVRQRLRAALRTGHQCPPSAYLQEAD